MFVQSSLCASWTLAAEWCSEHLEISPLSQAGFRESSRAHSLLLFSETALSVPFVTFLSSVGLRKVPAGGVWQTVLEHGSGGVMGQERERTAPAYRSEDTACLPSRLPLV